MKGIVVDGNNPIKGLEQQKCKRKKFLKSYKMRCILKTSRKKSEDRNEINNTSKRIMEYILEEQYKNHQSSL